MYPAVSKRFRIGGAHRPLVSRNHGTCCRFYVGQAILPAAAFQAARRLKAGGSQEWLPHFAFRF
jgi:hypothetical protein